MFTFIPEQVLPGDCLYCRGPKVRNLAHKVNLEQGSRSPSKQQSTSMDYNKSVGLTESISFVSSQFFGLVVGWAVKHCDIRSVGLCGTARSGSFLRSSVKFTTGRSLSGCSCSLLDALSCRGAFAPATHHVEGGIQGAFFRVNTCLLWCLRVFPTTLCGVIRVYV